MCDTRKLYFFFFNDTATTEIYTLSLHDALPIFDPLREELGRVAPRAFIAPPVLAPAEAAARMASEQVDRKSTRLNSSHANISYAVFCLKKKKHNTTQYRPNNTTSF